VFRCAQPLTGYASRMTGEPASDHAFRISVGSRDVVRVQWSQGSHITGALAAAAMAAVDELNGDRKRPLLVEMRGAATPTPEARERFGVPCTVSRIALLGESAVDRVHASFGPPGTVGRHPVPTRFFTSEPAALAWLLNETSKD
jgi:hypothetical protein